MIGKKLRDARTNAGLSQEKVAEILNTSRSNISKYENDMLEPNLQILKDICELYNISSDYLLGLNEQQQNNSNYISINQGHNAQANVNINNK